MEWMVPSNRGTWEGGDDLVSCNLGPHTAGPGTSTAHLCEAVGSEDRVRDESYEHQG